MSWNLFYQQVYLTWIMKNVYCLQNGAVSMAK